MTMVRDELSTPPAKTALGSVAVVGAGISGLAAAYRLKAEGVAVTVFEAECTSGGKIKSCSEDGFTWEKGPNTMTESESEVSIMIDGLHLRDRQQHPVMQSKRYIVRNGKPELLPSNPMAFFGSKLLSVQAKLRIVFEPFIWKRKECDKAKDESVGEFLERHFGREVVDYMVDPFIAGTSGSDPDSSSMQHAFRDVWNIEDQYGSLVVGAIRSALARKKARQHASINSESSSKAQLKPKRRPHGSFSFIGGMQTLTDAISDFIGQDSLRYNATVLSLACNQQGNPLRDSWKVSLSNDSTQAQHNFDAVIMTVPVSDFQQMRVCKDGKPYSLEFMPKVIYQPLSVLVTAFKKEDVIHPLDGFGVLIPSKEQGNGFQTLGTLFSSSMFPNRAPSGTLLFTSFIGGSRNRNLAARSTLELKEAAIQDLHQLVGVSGPPVFLKHIFWSRAFPQYGPGYDGVIRAMQKLEEDLPGFYYAGNHREGLSVGKALASGYNAAGHILEYLQSSGGRKLYTMASVNV